MAALYFYNFIINHVGNHWHLRIWLDYCMTVAQWWLVGIGLPFSNTQFLLDIIFFKESRKKYVTFSHLYLSILSYASYIYISFNCLLYWSGFPDELSLICFFKTN
jgi:hypothetical protein